MIKYFLLNKISFISARKISLYFLCYLLLVSACSKTPDIEQIESIVNEMVAAVENGKPGDISKHLHKNFRANRQMDARQVKQMLLVHGMQHAKISVTAISSETTVDPVYTDKAETTLSVIVTGSSIRGMPEDGSIRVVKLEWLKDSDWKLLKANWQ